MAANKTSKNDIVPPLPDYSSSSSDEKFIICPEHLSSSSRKRWTPQHERKREMEKGKSDASLAKIFDDPFFPLFERSEFLIATYKKKNTDRLCVCVDVRLILVLVWKKCLGFSVGYVLCASPYSSTSIMW